MVKYQNRTIRSFLFLLCLLPLAKGILAESIAPPFALGIHNNLEWELRVNHLRNPKCSHSNQKEFAWCKGSDSKEAANIAGVEAKIKSWIFNPKVKSIYLTFFSASNSGLKNALCRGAKLGKKITFIINESNFKKLSNSFKKCYQGKNLKVVAKGKGPFGSSGAHLMHMKIIMALETDQELDQVLSKSSSSVRFTSSSANLSRYGSSLHFENWLFFKAPASHYLAKYNLCVFSSLLKDNSKGNRKKKATTKVVLDSSKSLKAKKTKKYNPRKEFATHYKKCVDQYKLQKEDKDKLIDFYAVPAIRSFEKPIKGLEKMIFSKNGELKSSYVLVAAHRITTAQIYDKIFKRAAKELGPFSLKDNKGVGIILDDDTLRTSKVKGGAYQKVGMHDVRAMYKLRNFAELSFIETNAMHLHHNKFVITEDALFQGAGNFTSIAFNNNGYGNYEQFYIIRVPAIVKAYKNAWMRLRSISTLEEDHPVGNNQNKKLRDIGF